MPQEKNQVKRIIALIHLSELAAKDFIIEEWLLEFYDNVMTYVSDQNIKVSNIDEKDVLNVLHQRSHKINNLDGGNDIMSNI